MARQVNAEGIEHIKRLEGKRLKSYRDSAGIWTVGYGHTSDAGFKVHSKTKVTDQEATELLRGDLAEAEAAVNTLVKVKLSDNQFAALVSFVFNVGVGAFKKSTLLRKLNAGDYDGVPNELGKWVNAGGKYVKGLATRRASEAGLWAKGDFAATNTAKAEPKAVNPLLTPEGIGATVTTVGTVASAASGPGPLQWAVAGVVLVSIVIAAIFFARRIWERNP